MSNRRQDGSVSLRLLAIVCLLASLLAIITPTGHASVLQDNEGKKPPADQTPDKNDPAAIPKTNPEKLKAETESKGQKPKAADHDKNPVNVQKGQPRMSPAEQKRRAMSLLDDALAGADKIDPVEYGILVQVEAATVLWPLDKEHAIAIFRNAIKVMRDVLDAENQSKEKKAASQNRQTLRALALRKIAALKPALLTQLKIDDTSSDKSKPTMPEEWTQEARALIAVASDQMAKNPKLAAQLAETALPLGQADWPGFLSQLSQHDTGGAERLATTIINRIQNGPPDPIGMINFNSFILNGDRSPELTELYFQSMASQLRQTMRPNQTADDLADSLNAAKYMATMTGVRYPTWQAEFAGIASNIEAMFTRRALPIPGPPVQRIVDASMGGAAIPGSTQELAEAVSRADAITNPRARDGEYQDLAVKAAFNTDISLAESILSKIENDSIRRETNLSLYTPLVKKAIADATWSYAQRLALNIQDPLGRSILLDQIGQAMAQAHEDHALVIDVYRLAASRLEHEEMTQPAVKGYLILAKSLLAIDPESGAEMVNSAVWALNKVAKKDAPIEESPMTRWMSDLMKLPNVHLNPEDVLILPDLLGNVFGEMAKRDADESIRLADGIAHRGLYSLAHLAISKTLLKASRSPETASQGQPKPLAFSPTQLALIRHARLS